MNNLGRGLTIGVVINNLDMDYQRDVWKGVDEAARERGINALVYQGGAIDSPNEYDMVRNRVYDFLSPETIDGLIIVATTVVGPKGFSSLRARFGAIFDSLPVVTIGPAFPDVPSVAPDNASGLRVVIEHLIANHGKRNFVFMGGPNGNPDSDGRKAVFLETLAAHGLSPVANGMLEGGFRHGRAIEAINSWLDARVPFDALVVANDDMAFACSEVLSKRGYRIPEDVVITGFDDIPASRFFPVPLTTVRQPVAAIARTAMDTLLDMIATGRPGGNVVVPTSPIIRQSCGCFSLEVQGVALVASGHPVAADALAPGVSANEAKAATGDPLPNCAAGAQKRLREAFDRALSDPSQGDSFLSSFFAAVGGSEFEAGSLGECERFVSSLRGRLPPDKATRDFGEKLLHQARVMVAQRAESRQAMRLLESAEHNKRVQYAITSMIGAFSLQNLLDRLVQHFPTLNVKGCFLSLFVPETDSARSRLVLGYDANGRMALPEGGIEFDTVDLYPREFRAADGQRSFSVELLCQASRQIGIFVLDYKPDSFLFGTALSSQISSALRASMLVDELIEKDSRLNAAFAQLQSRADELERANARIREDQERLLSAEKMASLGRLTAGIAHEMNTPLAAVRASICEAQTLVREYRDSVGDGDVSDDDHRAIASEMDASLALADRAAEKAAAFIRSIKSQTRDSAADGKGFPFDAVAAIDDTIVLLAHALRHGKVTVKRDLPTGPVTLFGKPGKLSQVLTNLIVNSIDAMAPDGGTITVSLREVGDRVRISVRDTGCGIASENLTRVFDPLFTTKPFGSGTGLGLTIVHDIVTGDFAGKIDISSVVGEGTVVSLDLPSRKTEE